MIEDKIIIEESDENVNHFPILAQLGVLSLILIAIFSTFIFQKNEAISVSTPEISIKQNSTTDQSFKSTTIQKITDVSIVARNAYVWDVRNQRGLFEKNSTEIRPLASITKLMTALLAYELVKEETPTIVSVSAIKQEGNSGLSAGENLNIEKLSELALVSSSNDAAFALGASVGSLLGNNDPTTQFVKGMNIRADELGLDSLLFRNPTGLDLSESEAGAFGSARDVSFLLEYIVENYPEIVSPTTEQTARVYNSSGEFHDVENTNEITNLIPNLLGSKTGFTDLAGGNLTIAFDAGNNRPIIITVLGSTHDQRFDDMLKLVRAVQDAVSQ